MSAEPKVVVITGASQGIGAGLVEGFLGRGYRVVANSRKIEPSVSPDVLSIAGDVADPETAGRIIGTAIDRFGRVDTLVWAFHAARNCRPVMMLDINQPPFIRH
jgi:NAD(P)-dependent dehydrogenase (short-subunit alcohol dehydrogenase family)